MKKLSYQGASKILLNIVNAINDLIDGGGGSSGVQSVTVNQIQSTGKKIATITVDNQSTDLYAPNNSGGGGSDDGGWELIGEAVLTATWAQASEETVLFNCYWNAFELWSVFIGRDNQVQAYKIAYNGDIGRSPTFTYDANTGIVTATWGSLNYAKIFRGSLGSGHIIVDGNNVRYTSRKKLKFWGNVEVADNSQDDATTVRITGVSQTELSTAVNTLQTNFQGGVDAIYNACVSKGSTPASHSLADVVAGILAIPQGGGGGEVVLAGIVETIPKQTKGGIGIGDIATFL